jgi:hypothetical protein
VRRLLVRAALAAAAALAGCVDSAEPILPDSQPVLGTKLKLQLYSLRSGLASEPERVDYAWNDGLYARVSGSLKDVPAFSVHPFESGTFIIQTAPAKPKRVEYAVMRKLNEGVYLVAPVDESDTDQATRAANCKLDNNAACRIERREQLLALARATAAKQSDNGGLVIRLADVPEPAGRHKQPAKRSRR